MRFLPSIRIHRRNYKGCKRKGACRILCLGGSTTAYQYPPFLEEVLNQRNIGIKFSVIDKGIVAPSTSCILDNLESNLNAHHPDIVITMMGINDWVTHMPYELVSDSKTINFLKSFRFSKLTRLLWLYIVTGFKELKCDKLSKYIFQPKFIFQRGELQQVYTEEKALELNPANDSAYVELGWVYRGQGKLSEAEAPFKKALELNPANDRACRALKVLYIEMGNSRLAREYDNKAKELRLNYYPQMTIVIIINSRRS